MAQKNKDLGKRLESCSVMSISLHPHGLLPPASSVYGILQVRILEWVAISFSRGSSQPRSPTLQKDSLPSEPARKPKNTGVGSLSLFQGNFLTQESNQVLLHCRQILYQLNFRQALSKRIQFILCKIKNFQRCTV